MLIEGAFEQAHDFGAMDLAYRTAHEGAFLGRQQHAPAPKDATPDDDAVIERGGRVQLT